MAASLCLLSGGPPVVDRRSLLSFRGACAGAVLSLQVIRQVHSEASSQSLDLGSVCDDLRVGHPGA